jgi:hypothetical protein
MEPIHTGEVRPHIGAHSHSQCTHDTKQANARTKSVRLIGLVCLFFSALFAWTPPALSADPWSLSSTQRRAYLNYYAPVILKQADERNTANWGWDWITNYDFDRDGNFSTNLENWRLVDSYVANPFDSRFSRWRIRPTIYTALVEFKEGEDKSVILLYHVYHAMEENASIHDWERVEVRVNKVNGTPGGGSEQIAYVVVTTHSDHVVRTYPHADLNFMPSTTGRHVLIWQARWTDVDGLRKNELHHVKTGWPAVDTAFKTCPTCKAEVSITDTNTKQLVHYAFIPGHDPAAVTYWGALELNRDNAHKLAAKAGTAAPYPTWGTVKRISYELQDLADILPTHAYIASCSNETYPREHGWGPYDMHWDIDEEKVGIWLDQPIKSEAGVELVPASSECNRAVTFYGFSRDTTDPSDGAQGYPNKHWFWGAYVMGDEQRADEVFDGQALVAASTGNTQKRNCSQGYRQYWCQHDYYAHTGSTQSATHGRWLPVGWATPEQGGFDGRWMQLYPDHH